MAKQFRWLGHQIAGWRKGPFSHWEKGRACTREGAYALKYRHHLLITSPPWRFAEVAPQPVFTAQKSLEGWLGDDGLQ
jgi:hypothetical protein